MKHMTPVWDYEPSLPFRFYTALLGIFGANSGTNMAVDGSTSPQNFLIKSSPIYDISIMRISIVVIDSEIKYSKFGTIDFDDVPNGWDLSIREGSTNYPIVEKARSTGGIIAQTGFHVPFGDGDTAFELPKFKSNKSAQAITFPIGEMIPGGLRLVKNSSDALIATVNDDLSTLDEFYVRVYGARLYATGKSGISYGGG